MHPLHGYLRVFLKARPVSGSLCWRGHAVGTTALIINTPPGLHVQSSGSTARNLPNAKYLNCDGYSNLSTQTIDFPAVALI